MGSDTSIRQQYIRFFCNCCLRFKRAQLTSNLREGLVCPTCGLNARQRALMFAVQSIYRKDFLKRFNIQIVGISDGEPVCNAFRERFSQKYTNFEFHVEPFLDITSIDSSFSSIANIVSCSEVLEHVKPPVELAFKGLFELLKPGGYLVLSVPHGGSEFLHKEHFPIMVNSELIEGPPRILRGIDLDGRVREFSELVFHGGAGATLEYRIFSEVSLRDNLQKAGFVSIQPQGNRRLLGILWEPWSRVWIARKPITETAT